MRVIVIAILLSILTASSVYAHSGRTDKNGGHYNRKTGVYHCHKAYCVEPYSQKKSSLTKQKPSSVSLEYNRKQWKHWIDEDKDCQNTRHEILIKYSEEPVQFKTDRNCRVVIGKWTGLYTGKVFGLASMLDIDHVIPLKHAHQSGGHAWSSLQKRAFANDYENLLAVDKSANRSKGAKGPAKWKPSDRGVWCAYAERWRYLKSKYDLSVSAKEENALRDMEATCQLIR